MKTPSVPLPKWRFLYEQMRCFGDLAPWTFMADDELFAVRDPVTGDMGYATVLGALGEMHALCVYRGNRGYAALRRILNGQIDENSLDILDLQDALAAELADREELTTEDRAVIKALGLKFRGRKAWPMFRSHLPAFAPWPLTEPEAQFLALALACACNVAEKVDRGELDLAGNRHRILVCEPDTPEREDAVSVTTRWEPLPACVLPTPEPVHISEERVHAILAKCEQTRPAVEADCLLLPGAVTDRERPYFPRCALVVDADGGMILDANMMHPETPRTALIAEGLLRAMEQLKVRPATIAVRDPGTAGALGHLADTIGAEVIVRNPLPSLDEAWAALESAMSSGLI